MGQDFDAIVVGAGLCGSWAARELTSGGMRVALLDAGPLLNAKIFHGPFRQETFRLKDHLFRINLLARGMVDKSTSDAISQTTQDLFLDRRSAPYLTPDGPFSWQRVRAVGGRGHLWARVMLRLTPQQLNDPTKGWPLRYSDLEPFYDLVEQTLELGGPILTTPKFPTDVTSIRAL